MCFCTILVILVLSINERYVRLNLDNDNVQKFDKVPYDIQYCNFGSSHGLNDYCYDELDNEFITFNFALPSQSLLYDYKILEYYKDHISKDAIVFINISYFSFYGIDETMMDNFESKNKRYYKFLPRESILNFDWKTYIYEVKFPSLCAYDKLFLGLLFGEEKQEDEWETQTAYDIDMDAYSKAAYERHIIKNRVDENGNRIINSENVEALYKMIEICRDIGATPILITTPYLTEYTDRVKENSGFYDDFYDKIDQIVSNTGVEYYNYAFDKRFSNNYALFMNADHLNKTGALRFVDILMQEVVEGRR